MAEMLSQVPDDPPFSHAAIRSSSLHTSFDSNAPYTAQGKNSFSHCDLQSPLLSSSQRLSCQPTPASSLSLETKFNSSSDDEGLAFPAYSPSGWYKGMKEPGNVSPSSPMHSTTGPRPSLVDDVSWLGTPAPTPDTLSMSEDDMAVRQEPSQHVDYLSHDWKEENIWSSWRHIVRHRFIYGKCSRLENASWRMWARIQFKLKTVSPETLKWLKDYDVSWLYGPLQPASDRLSQNASEPGSQLSKTNSILKPILKKRSTSEIMLQKSLLSSSLVRQAAAIIQAQRQARVTIMQRKRQRPIIGRAMTDFVSSSQTTTQDPTDYFSSRSTSGLQPPIDQNVRKTIRFDDKVEQCIAVDYKDVDDYDQEDFNRHPWAKYWDDESSDKSVIMMKQMRRRRPLSRSSSERSISGESKIIAKLPSTTLKCRTDAPDVKEQQLLHSLGFWCSSMLSSSPSEETLKPLNPPVNFLLEDDEEENFTFNPSGV